MNAQFQQLLLHQQQQQQHRESEQEQQQGHHREESGYYSQDQGQGETHGESHATSVHAQKKSRPPFAHISNAYQSYGDYIDKNKEYTQQPQSQGPANNEIAGGQGTSLQIEHPSPSRSPSS
jgi:hypothetical protein